MNFINTSILITGGAGFIGSNIAEYLLKNNIKFIRILDNLSNGNLDNIKDLLDKYNNIEFLWGDINDLETCRKAMIGINKICHQAAIGSVPRSIENPIIYHQSNVNGFFNILIAAKEAGIKRIVYASSSSVYGDSELLPKNENNIGKLLSPYAATKLIDEIYAQIFTKCYNMELIGFRYFNVFGPKQNPNGVYAAVIPKFINLFYNNNSPQINGDGSFSRDFTYIQNVIDANITGLFIDNIECYGEVYNIGCGERHTILDICNFIREYMKKTDIEINFGNERKGDIPHSLANIDKAIKYLNYNPQINLQKGLELTINYFINQLKKSK
jgi:UDP-N-acetylglucosamine/UDP-N-acetylgalactosamine 4-epimerase